MLAVPHIIEHAYCAFAGESQAIVGGLDCAAKLVVAHPGVGKRVVGHINDVFVVVASDLCYDERVAYAWLEAKLVVAVDRLHIGGVEIWIFALEVLFENRGGSTLAVGGSHHHIVEAHVLALVVAVGGIEAHLVI